MAGLLALQVPAASAAEPSPGAEDRDDSAELADSELREIVDGGRSAIPRSDRARGGGVIVEILHGAGDAAAVRGAVAAAGGDVTGEVPTQLVQAEVPIGALEGLEAKGSVDYIRLPLDYNEPVADGDEPGAELELARPTDAISEAVDKTGASAWHADGFIGAGVEVGIIDSFQGAAYNAAVAAGEIPAASGTFCRNAGVPCSIFDATSNHGVAVAESVTDMAPGASLYLASVSTASDTQAALDYFAANGVRVVTRSTTGRYDGPGDGTGPIATVIENGAVARGIFYLNSAGNSAGRLGYPGSYWRGSWVDTDADNWLNFPDGSEYMQWDCAYQNGLRWNDWAAGTGATDYDLYVYDYAFAQVDSSEDAQGGGAPPLELATGCTTAASLIAIKRYSVGNGSAGDILEFMTNGSEVEFHSDPYSATGPMSDLNSAGAVAVGAVDPWSGTTIAKYSSEGPTNDGRMKPELSAPSCFSSFTKAPSCFNGTSAATPIVAGAAALVLGSGVRSTPQGVRDYLMNYSVVDRGAVGPDNVYGMGELHLPPSPDMNPPTVRALKAKGKAGKRIRLDYAVGDDRGTTTETLVVYRRGREVTSFTSPLGPVTGETYGFTWKSPKRPRNGYTFCVSATDAAGNGTPASCADIKLKKAKKRRR